MVSQRSNHADVASLWRGSRRGRVDNRPDEKKHLDVIRLSVIRLYDQNMGREDMADGMISYYRIKAKVRKCTIHCMVHLWDLAQTNSWLQYRAPHEERKMKRKDIMQFLEFRLSFGAKLMNTPSVETSDMEYVWSPQKEAPLPSSEFRSKGVLPKPMIAPASYGGRCCDKGFTKKTKCMCTRCELLYCITKQTSCFEEAHKNAE